MWHGSGSVAGVLRASEVGVETHARRPSRELKEVNCHNGYLKRMFAVTGNDCPTVWECPSLSMIVVRF